MIKDQAFFFFASLMAYFVFGLSVWYHARKAPLQDDDMNSALCPLLVLLCLRMRSVSNVESSNVSELRACVRACMHAEPIPKTDRSFSSVPRPQETTKSRHYLAYVTGPPTHEARPRYCCVYTLHRIFAWLLAELCGS